MIDIPIDTTDYEHLFGKPVGRAFWSFRIVSADMAIWRPKESTFEEPPHSKFEEPGERIIVTLKNTKMKLGEARFFLHHLQKYQSAATSGNPMKPDGQAFAYYLSAFISAARSVPWVLQAEEKEKYDAWIVGWEERRRSWAEAEGVDIDRLLKLTNEMRVNVAKREGQVKTRIQTEMVPVTVPSWENNRYHINVVLLGLSPEDAVPRTSSETQYIEGTDQEVVKLCEQYVRYLEALLLDFEREHSVA
jgi:hypothetical protein